MSKKPNEFTAADLAKIRWYLSELETHAIALYTAGEGEAVDDALSDAFEALSGLKLPPGGNPCPPGWYLCPTGCSPRPCLGGHEPRTDTTPSDRVQ